MTVITALITRECTVHGSDSFITTVSDDKRYEVVESQTTKIVRIPCHRGLVSYWGLATYPKHSWSTLDWLKERVKVDAPHNSPEQFALHLKDALNDRLAEMKLLKIAKAGVGIHLTAYESVDNYRVPELFRISNYTNTSYDKVFPNGVHCTRETYNQLTDTKESRPEHRDRQCRMDVRKFLSKQDSMLIYNNGDPVLFNPVANTLLESVRVISGRGELKSRDVEMYRGLVKRAIDIVCMIQEGFVQEERVPASANPRRYVLSGRRRIGGRRHAIAVTPKGEYIPLTGG